MNYYFMSFLHPPLLFKLTIYQIQNWGNPAALGAIDWYDSPCLAKCLLYFDNRQITSEALMSIIIVLM